MCGCCKPHPSAHLHGLKDCKELSDMILQLFHQLYRATSAGFYDTVALVLGCTMICIIQIFLIHHLVYKMSKTSVQTVQNLKWFNLDLHEIREVGIICVWEAKTDKHLAIFLHFFGALSLCLFPLKLCTLPISFQDLIWHIYYTWNMTAKESLNLWIQRSSP